LGSFAYTIGATGNRLASTETVNGASRAYNWAYDYLYRLTGETNNMGSINYGFDAVGNRTNRTSTIVGITSQASAFTANDWLGTDTYDTNGNTTVSGSNGYQYDVMNHLTNVNSGTVLITYDGDGNRVRKTVGGVTTWYLVDSQNPSGYAQVLEEYQGSSLNRVYNYGMALVSQRQVSGGTISYFGSDGHGSTRFLADASGVLSDTYAYDAYGLLIASSGSTTNNYLYCGQQFDSDLGFYYLRARYYKPDSGRFWTMDSYSGNSEDPLSLHKYLYCQGDPVDNDDPSGHDGELAGTLASVNIGIGIAAFSGAALLEAKTHAIGNLAVAAYNEASADGASLSATAESILSVYRTSVRQMISDARQMLKQAGKAFKKVKIVPMPRSVIRDVADHVAAAQASGKPVILNRAPATQYASNRTLATGSHPPAAAGNSLDEYPFAASMQGGAGASVKEVPAWQNFVQGAIIRWSYKYENISVGMPYIVVVTP